ncbi:unnamed protein product [Arctogadus glacialis]
MLLSVFFLLICYEVCRVRCPFRSGCRWIHRGRNHRWVNGCRHDFSSAVANGGAVAAGTTVAVLQSVRLVWGQWLLLQLLVQEQQLHWL